MTRSRKTTRAAEHSLPPLEGHREHCGVGWEAWSWRWSKKNESTAYRVMCAPPGRCCLSLRTRAN